VGSQCFLTRDSVYGEVVTDQQFRTGVIAGAILLIAVITSVRFCGNLSLPPKPAQQPHGATGTSRQLLTKSAASPEGYQRFLQTDAELAGVRAPTVEEMSRKLVYRVDEARHVLELGKPPIELAGLRLHIERTGDQVVLVIVNTLDSDVAYHVVTNAANAYACRGARPLPFNAMVLHKGDQQTRAECIAGTPLYVTKAETLELLPLSAYYLSQLPPKLVGLDDHTAAGHRGSSSAERCVAVMATVVQSGIERGDITWRDLVDFYARHRCQTYRFPSSYHAVNADGQTAIPAVDSAM
jgi:hypothetical protein